MNLIIMDHKEERYDTGIPLDIVNEIDAVIISGDENLVVLQSTGKISHFDASDFNGNPRIVSLYDGRYIVHKEDVAEWNDRSSTSEWANRSVFDG